MLNRVSLYFVLGMGGTMLGQPNLSKENPLDDRGGIEAAVHALERGSPLGVLARPSFKEKEKGKEKGPVSENKDKQFKTAQQSMDSLDETHAKILSEYKGLFKQESKAASAVPPVFVVPKTIEAKELSFSKFLKCAEDSLPKLKLILSSREIQTDISALPLVYGLNIMRGDGRFNSNSGLACGLFLGRHGFSTTNLEEQVKILSSFVTRSDSSDRQYLLYVFANYSKYRRQERMNHGPFWEHAWRALNYLAVFSRGPLPLLSALKERYTVDYATIGKLENPQGRQAHIELDPHRLAAAIDHDWAKVQEEVPNVAKR